MMSQDEVSEQADAMHISQGQMLNITLLASEWKSSAGGLSTLNRELAIHLSQIQNVRASLLVPEGACNDEDKREARSFGISILDAGKCAGFEPLLWLSNPPLDHNIDVIVGHGVKLGCQAQFIKRQAQFQNCQWVHVIHTAPEDISKYRGYSRPISRDYKKYWDNVDLCKCADLVISVGPRLGEAYRSYLQDCKKDEDFFELVPGVFEREFGDLPAKQNPKDKSDNFIVLLCGRGDEEDFEFKGYDIAVKAFADQRLRRKHYSLLFVGSPEGKQDEVRKRLLKYGIADEQLTVRKFIKSRERMKELFCEVDMVIMPSKSEGFGLVALEALSAGLPILVGRNSGFARAIENIPHGKWSIVGDSGNPAKWAEAIQDVRYRHGMVLEESKILKESYSKKYCWKKQCQELFDRLWKMIYGAGSPVPAEIRARGPRAERAFQKALQTGTVKVYRGRIMLLGQDRAGKTSLKKSLLCLPFDPNQESTVAVEVDRSKCKLEMDEVENWRPSKRKEREVSEFEEEIARCIVRDLTESEANDNDSTAILPNVEELKTNDQLEEKKDHEEPKLLPDVHEPAYDTEEKSEIAKDGQKALSEEKPVDKNEVSNVLQLNISSTTLPNNVTDQVVRYLQSRQLEDDIKSKEVILTLWDFAGQHLYYASHSVFLSGRAVYILVYNLNKNLLATAEPCVRQGMNEILLDNPNNETNLDNLLSWLVSVHSIRSNANTNVAHQGTKQSYLRPPVILVGTNLDQPFEEVTTTEKRIKNSILHKEYAKHVITPFFTIDNKTENDEVVRKLRHKIMEVLKDEPYMGEEVPLRWFNFERAVDALVAKQTYFMDLDQLLTVIRQVCHIDDEEEVTAMLNFYHDLGVIVKHGRTVVLQAQWLIDLFKQLITVPPYDKADPLYVDCWRHLEVNGILRIALVDHVFSKFIKKGLRKQDILDMMELHGLIAKFSNATDENQDEQRYFVPTQLRSSPSALCEIEPSECDPCPLVLHFLEGFVPHGLFPQLVSKFIHWCSENGFKNTPQLFNNGVRLFVGKQIVFDLILICRKRFIQIVLKRRNASSSKPLSMNASNKMAIEVRNFIQRTLDGFSRDLCWLSNLRYELGVVCNHCLQRICSLHRLMSCCQDDCVHLLRVRPGEELICPYNFSDETVKVPGLEKWFKVPHSKTKEPKEDTSEAVGLDESVSFGNLSQVDVLLIAHELAPSWKKVALALNVPRAEIKAIEADETKVFERCYAVLTRWQEMYPYDATRHRLALALMNPAVGRVDVAAKYCGHQGCSSGKDVAVTKDY